MTDFPNRARAIALLTRHPNRAAAASAMAATTCRISIEGEITAATAASVKRKLAACPNAGTIHVTIDSEGGDLAAAFEIFDAIRAHRAATKICNGVGAVHSAAALVFAAGDVRRLSPGATVLLHGIELEPGGSGRFTARRYAALAKRVAALDGGVAATIAERCGVDPARIEREMNDESMTPHSRALALKLATEIAT